MVEQTTGRRRMGQERWKYLDMANMSFAAGAYIETNGYITAFLETIKDGSKEANEIQKEFDEIEETRKKQRDDLEAQIKDLGYLEQNDIRSKGRDQIEIEAIYNRKTVCWTVAMNNGLFGA